MRQNVEGGKGTKKAHSKNDVWKISGGMTGVAARIL